MLWMPYIFLVIFGAVAIVPEWRATALIIFIASLANIIYQPILNIAAAQGNLDVPLVHVAADSITILALLKWGSRGWKGQAAILTLFMAWNAALLLDYRASPYPIYESYKEVIFALNLTQILLISGGIYAVAGRATDFILGGLGKNIPHLHFHRNGPDRDMGKGQ